MTTIEEQLRQTYKVLRQIQNQVKQLEQHVSDHGQEFTRLDSAVGKAEEVFNDLAQEQQGILGCVERISTYWNSANVEEPINGSE